MSLITDLQKYTYPVILQDALSRVPNTVDKREGSIIYDALAPACYELAMAYTELIRMYYETYVEFATGESLDYRVQEIGLTRYQASAAVKRGVFTDSSDLPATVPIGSRFSTLSTGTPLTYVVIAEYKDSGGTVVPGSYQLQCETLGTVGHSYTGQITPIDYLPTLKTATLTDTIIPGRDVETDEELRERYYARVNARPFGGNVAQYREMLMEIAGVGAVQVYPVWAGGGTVKVSIIDATWQPVTEDFINYVQNLIDPDAIPDQQGTGLGMAPIDHRVTVVTADQLAINVEAHLTLSGGSTIDQVTPLVRAVIETYLNELRHTWGSPNEFNVYNLTVYAARISAAILNIGGIINVTGIVLNGQGSDLVLIENSNMQQLPVLGEVRLYESA